MPGSRKEELDFFFDYEVTAEQLIADDRIALETGFYRGNNHEFHLENGNGTGIG